MPYRGSHGLHIQPLAFVSMAIQVARDIEDRFINRELSWIDFNRRVLALAEDPTTPLLERIKFLAIYASNLDEFYMVRVAGLKRQVEAGVQKRSPDGMTPRAQLKAISDSVRADVERYSDLFVNDVMPALTRAGVELLRWGDLDDTQKKELDEFFENRMFAVVTPLAVDPGHPFPYISNLSLNLAVMVKDPATALTHFARVKVPPVLPRFLQLESEPTAFVPIEDVIAANLDELFPGMDIVEHHAFRVTRNADLEVDDDGAEDLLVAVEEELSRRRFSPAVRLEIEKSMPDHVLRLLVRELQVDEDDVHSVTGPLALSSLWDLHSLDRPDLKDEPFSPVTHPDLTSSDELPANIFKVLKTKDVLVQHPYDSFATSVLRFIEQAAADPSVLAIKQTLYRTSGESPIVEALMDAAQAGKQVVVLVEIKARFDERANINWARTLERAGCHVVYGVMGLKTHCKLCLVVRQEGDDLKKYVHVGTGNYNTKTARLYEDIGVLTSEPQLGVDVSDLFNYLTGYSRHADYETMLVAPHSMRNQIVEMIEREAEHARAGKDSGIVMKLNALVDEAVIDALYEASGAGVPISLLVRGICALRPGIEGLSETISVRSILGRFLEHSRIIRFFNDGQDDFYIGSADMMHRNLDRRVESMVRVQTRESKARLASIFSLAFRDNASAWYLSSDGSWTRVMPETDERIDFQKTLMQRALEHDRD
jgi:polyphosphate kinase